MKQIPNTENAPVLRTDFSSQTAWESICADIRKPVGVWRFRANVDFIDEVEFANISKVQLLELVPRNYSHSFIVIVDQTAISQPEHPLLVIDLFDKPVRDFRAIPTMIQSIENNLSIGNMDFEEFADAVERDGIFRGFPEDGQNPFLS
jgi:uncharacterized protein YbcV (DUF1398 family)